MAKIIGEIKKLKEDPKAKEKPQYRYYCDACTGIAFYLFEGQSRPTSVICGACGKILGKFKSENLLRVI